MPANVVKTDREERLWNKAKTQASRQGHDKDWRYVMGIFKKMTKKATLDPKKLRLEAHKQRFKKSLKDRKLLHKDLGLSKEEGIAMTKKYNKARAKEVLGK